VTSLQPWPDGKMSYRPTTVAPTSLKVVGWLAFQHPKATISPRQRRRLGGFEPWEYLWRWKDSRPIAFNSYLNHGGYLWRWKDSRPTAFNSYLSHGGYLWRWKDSGPTAFNNFGATVILQFCPWTLYFYGKYIFMENIFSWKIYFIKIVGPLETIFQCLLNPSTAKKYTRWEWSKLNESYPK